MVGLAFVVLHQKAFWQLTVSWYLVFPPGFARPRLSSYPSLVRRGIRATEMGHNSFGGDKAFYNL